MRRPSIFDSIASELFGESSPVVDESETGDSHASAAFKTMNKAVLTAAIGGHSGNEVDELAALLAKGGRLSFKEAERVRELMIASNAKAKALKEQQDMSVDLPGSHDETLPATPSPKTEFYVKAPNGSLDLHCVKTKDELMISTSSRLPGTKG